MTRPTLPPGYSELPAWLNAHGSTSYEFNRVYDPSNRLFRDLCYWQITSLRDCNYAPPSATLYYRDLHPPDGEGATEFDDFASPFVPTHVLDEWLRQRRVRKSNERETPISTMAGVES